MHIFFILNGTRTWIERASMITSAVITNLLQFFFLNFIFQCFRLFLYFSGIKQTHDWETIACYVLLLSLWRDRAKRVLLYHPSHFKKEICSIVLFNINRLTLAYSPTFFGFKWMSILSIMLTGVCECANNRFSPPKKVQPTFNHHAIQKSRDVFCALTSVAIIVSFPSLFPTY
jgi:hypothetical protein